MLFSLKKVFRFLRKNPELLFSLFLIIFLPLIIWANNVFIVKSFEKITDFTLQNTALSLENVIEELIREKIKDLSEVQQIIELLAKEDPAIEELRVIRFEKDTFKIIASSNRKDLGKEVREASLAIAWHQNQNIAHLVGSKKERFWQVVKPIFAKDNQKIALVTLNLSLKETDKLIKKAVYFSYFVSILAIIFTLLLVAWHTRLFQYLKLYKELKRVEKMKEEFIRMAIHELQSPIVNIKGYIETLKEDAKDPSSEEFKRDIERISLSAKNLSDLIYDIMTVVRIEESVLDVFPQLVFPSEIVQEIVDSFKIKVKEKGLEFFYQKLPSANFRIKVQPNRFREILTNLIENAIKYTFKGKIEVKEELLEKENLYSLSIEDTGIGISGEDQERIFEKFYRVKEKETAEIPGTGLGLWIVKTLTEKMGGKIVLESIKGVGSKFKLFFPIYKPK